MPTVTDLLTANLHDVFGNRDAASRRASIERIYTDDVVFTDPEGVSTGWDALEGKARDLLAKVPPSFAFTEDGNRYVGPENGALAWSFGPEGGEPAVRGIDILTVRDGRIATIVTLFAG